MSFIENRTFTATLIAVYELFMTPLGVGLGIVRLGLCHSVVPRD